MESIIKWHTGIPSSTGVYLITTDTNAVIVTAYIVTIEKGFHWKTSHNVIAWCPLIDIEPYKE